jgi:flagellar hook assembly protein FlgD
MDGVVQNQQATEAWKRFQSTYGEKAKAPREFKKALDQDDFLKIMITQMKNQDPTKPFESEKLAQEIAQIASVEQMSRVNQTLKDLSQANSPLEKLGMTNLIGKEVVVDLSRFEHTKGQNNYVSFNLSESASNAKVELVHESGEVMYTKKLADLDPGTNGFKWDGTKDNSLPAPGGVYYLRVDAKDMKGADVPTEFTVKSQVEGVSYTGKEPMLVVNRNGQKAKISMKTVVSIEQAAAEAAAQQAQSAGAPQTAAPSAPKGSQAIALPPQLQRKVNEAAADLGMPTQTTTDAAADREKVVAQANAMNAALQESIRQKLAKGQSAELAKSNPVSQAAAASAGLNAGAEAKATQGRSSDDRSRTERRGGGFPSGLSPQASQTKSVSGSSKSGGARS